ncbi:MAG: hypothetical protein AAF989_07210, partial [Planctomycetota bacterium]
ASHRVSVPSRVGTDKLRWRTIGDVRFQEEVVQATDLDSENSVENPSGAASPSDSAIQWLIDGEDWSVDLMPGSQERLPMEILARDVHVFVRDTTTLIQTRFLVEPGSKLQCDFSIPRSSTLLRATVDDEVVLENLSDRMGRDGPAKRGSRAGLALKVETEVASRTVGPDEGDEESGVRETIRIPLLYARLPQMVDVLLRVPTKQWLTAGGDLKKGVESLVPSLVRPMSPAESRISEPLPSWISWHVPWVDETNVATVVLDAETNLNQGDDSTLIGNAKRSAVLSELVEETLLTVSDTFADRSTSELKSWARPWGQWLVQLRTGTDTKAIPPSSDGAALAEDGIAALAAFDWTQNELVNGRDDAATRIGFGSSPGFRLIDVRDLRRARMDGNAKVGWATTERDGAMRQEIATSISPESPFRWLLRNVLVLVVGLGGLVSAFPYRGRIERSLQQPVVWLTLLGVSFLVVAPPPIAIAVILVGICFALFPNSSRKTTANR